MPKDCSTCRNLQRFTKRSDEPSGMGCKAGGWEGYVLDETKPVCMGVNGPLHHYPLTTT